MNSYIRLRGSVIKQNCHEYRSVIVRYLSSSLAKHGNKVLSKVISEMNLQEGVAKCSF